MRVSTSSSSVCLRCASSAFRSTLYPWKATAPTPRSTAPERTSAITVRISSLIWTNSLFVFALPPLDWPLRLAGALAGLCTQQKPSGPLEGNVQGLPSFLLAEQVIQVRPSPPPTRRFRRTGRRTERARLGHVLSGARRPWIG